MTLAVLCAAFKTRVKPTARLVLLALADHCDQEGTCSPTISMICNRTGLSDRAVQASLLSLEATGHIERSFVNGGPTVYAVHPIEGRS